MSTVRAWDLQYRPDVVAFKDAQVIGFKEKVPIGDYFFEKTSIHSNIKASTE